MFHSLRLCVFAFAAALLGGGCSSLCVDSGGQVGGQASAQSPEVKNIIFLIGDGMGLAQVSGVSVAAKAPLAIERATVIGLAKTTSASHYVTDSAASGTALATGFKTTNGVIGLDPQGQPLDSILLYAQGSGRSVGVVATSTITHATPAAFVARNPARRDQEGIALDFLRVRPDVFIGGGREFFDQRKDGRTLTAELRRSGYTVAATIEEVQGTKAVPLAGLLADKALPKAAERGPVLAQATTEALRLLSANPRGFVLMVEGSQIDWAAHANDWEFTLSETLDFDAAVRVAFAFADENPGTLVVITADHETGGLSLIGGDLAKGSVETAWGTKKHSATMVPVYAYGAGAEAFAGVYENTDIFFRMLGQLGIKAAAAAESAATAR